MWHELCILTGIKKPNKRIVMGVVVKYCMGAAMALALSGCGVASGITGGEMLAAGAGVVAGRELEKQGIDPVPPKGERTAKGYANQLRDNVKKTGAKIQEWWFTPLPSTEPLPVASSYCYKAQTDILCYRQPMPGWEHRLVAYQGTGAAPPPPATMQLMPQKANDNSKLAENRLANVKPIFVELPPEPKQAPKDASQPTTDDHSQEVLPDPTLTPQL